MNALNHIDIFIAVIILFSGVLGTIRGFTREVLGIGGWVGAIAVTFYTWPLLQPFGREYIKNPMLADGVVVGGIFLASLILLMALSQSLSQGIQRSILGGADRSVGMVFGCLRGWALTMILFVVTLFIWGKEQPKSIEESTIRPYLQQTIRWIDHMMDVRVFPSHIEDMIYEGYPKPIHREMIKIPSLEN